MVMPIRSALANASIASFTSGMTVTCVPSKVGSWASLVLLCGAKYRVATSSHRSRTPSKVSREWSANLSCLVSASTSSHSYSRKSRSRLDSRLDFIGLLLSGRGLQVVVFQHQGVVVHRRAVVG